MLFLCRGCFFLCFSLSLSLSLSLPPFLLWNTYASLNFEYVTSPKCIQEINSDVYVKNVTHQHHVVSILPRAYIVLSQENSSTCPLCCGRTPRLLPPVTTWGLRSGGQDQDTHTVTCITPSFISRAIIERYACEQTFQVSVNRMDALQTS